MSWRASHYVRTLRTAPNGERVTSHEKALLLILAEYYNDEQGAAWPAIGRIADDLGLTRRRIQQLLTSVTCKGILDVEQRCDWSGGSTSNRYTFPGLDGLDSEDRGTTLAPPTTDTGVTPDTDVTPIEGAKQISPPPEADFIPPREMCFTPE